MDETARQAELARARREAAASRVELAQFTKAFSHLDDEARTWLLETIGFTAPGAPEGSLAEAGKRFGELTYTWMGENFVPWAQDLVGTPSTDIGDETEMDEQRMVEILGQFQEHMTKTIDEKFAGFQTNMDESTKQDRFNSMLATAKHLGYDPEDWKGTLFFQVAANETGGDFEAAHQLLIDRGISEETPAPVDTVEAATVPATPPVAPQPALVPPVPVAAVPPTGGEVGGLGIAENMTEEVMDFAGASDATLELLTNIAAGE